MPPARFCHFCQTPVIPCPNPAHHRSAGSPNYCYGWVHQNNGTHRGHPDNPHSAQPAR